MKKNIIDKIWDSHVVKHDQGFPAVFAIDKMILHEVTSAQAFDVLRQRNLKVKFPERVIATLDHSIPTSKNREYIRDEDARHQVETMRKNSKEFGIPFYDMGSGFQGVVHVMAPELGFTQPGDTIVCGDSHTATHGAFGAMAFGIGTTEVGHSLATGCILQNKPKTMKVVFKGTPGKNIYSKDLILKLISIIGIGGAKGHIIEYAGDVIKDLSMEARMTLCNMSIECGARAGLVAPDEKTYEYLKGKKYSPKQSEWQKHVDYWKSLKSDEGADFDSVITVDIEGLKPMVSWGINPGQSFEITESLPKIDALPEDQKQMAKEAYDYTGLEEGNKIIGTPVQWAFLGSCTNGRIEDLRIAASILKGKKVADGVTFYIVPGSEQVRKQAIDEGLDKIFIESGADFRMPGCSMCLAMNDDKVPPGQRCISTSNRNFMGRQGPGSRTNLASPAVVAYSALAGHITTEI